MVQYAWHILWKNEYSAHISTVAKADMLTLQGPP